MGAALPLPSVLYPVTGHITSSLTPVYCFEHYALGISELCPRNLRNKLLVMILSHSETC